MMKKRSFLKHWIPMKRLKIVHCFKAFETIKIATSAGQSFGWLYLTFQSAMWSMRLRIILLKYAFTIWTTINRKTVQNRTIFRFIFVLFYKTDKRHSSSHVRTPRNDSFRVTTCGATPADIVVTTGSICVFVCTTSKREANWL